MNQLVRSQFRKRRKVIEQSKDRDKKLLSKASLKIKLVEPTDSIREEAKKIYRTGARRREEVTSMQNLANIAFNKSAGGLRNSIGTITKSKKNTSLDAPVR